MRVGVALSGGVRRISHRGATAERSGTVNSGLPVRERVAILGVSVAEKSVRSAPNGCQRVSSCLKPHASQPQGIEANNFDKVARIACWGMRPAQHQRIGLRHHPEHGGILAFKRRGNQPAIRIG